ESRAQGCEFVGWYFIPDSLGKIYSYVILQENVLLARRLIESGSRPRGRDPDLNNRRISDTL
ncbi:MAG TPA: hypothetical protein VIE65_18365, partial [Methylobacter sp.]